MTDQNDFLVSYKVDRNFARIDNSERKIADKSAVNTVSLNPAKIAKALADRNRINSLLGTHA